MLICWFWLPKVWFRRGYRLRSGVPVLFGWFPVGAAFWLLIRCVRWPFAILYGDELLLSFFVARDPQASLLVRLLSLHIFWVPMVGLRFSRWLLGCTALIFDSSRFVEIFVEICSFLVVGVASLSSYLHDPITTVFRHVCRGLGLFDSKGLFMPASSVIGGCDT
ncbi:hypothetical protein P8452_77890 [Trifolium repens]|nr:hypothetical protein P8452_77890 [Trifolium repens]